MKSETQYCTFFVDGLYFGIDVLRVQEVVRTLPLTRVPLAAPAVKGLINLRGQLVTAIDLRTALHLTPRDDSDPPMNVVVRTDDGALSLLVDDIGDVIVPDESTFESPPETMPAAARAFIKGVYKLPSKLLLVLDTVGAISNVGATRTQ